MERLATEFTLKEVLEINAKIEKLYEKLERAKYRWRIARLEEQIADSECYLYMVLCHVNPSVKSEFHALVK